VAAATLFADLSPDLRSSISRELRRIHLLPGELLWRQGDPSGGLHLVESGRLAITARAPGEREMAIAEVGPGEVLGELPLLAGGERTASVRAIEAASVLVLDRARFRALLAALDPAAEALRRRLLEIVCRRLRARHADLTAMLGSGPAPPARENLSSRPAAVPARSYLARLTLFRELEPRELDELLAAADVVEVARGAELCAEGAWPGSCAVTLNGALEELVRRGDRAVRVRLAGPGVASCYVGLFDGAPSSVAVSARTRVRLALIPRAGFDELVAARTRAGRSFLEALQRDLVDALRRAERQQARLTFG
jgi:CRP/FNR family transcriptional regulator, cyclic AMP receptor protein